MGRKSHSFRLDGKVAVVTGGASGIGRAVAESFSHRGACVCVLDINEDAANTVVQDINGAGGHGEAYFCDVSQLESVKSVLGGIFANERVDILVNNAGISQSLRE